MNLEDEAREMRSISIRKPFDKCRAEEGTAKDESSDDHLNEVICRSDTNNRGKLHSFHPQSKSCDDVEKKHGEFPDQPNCRFFLRHAKFRRRFNGDTASVTFDAVLWLMS